MTKNRTRIDSKRLVAFAAVSLLVLGLQTDPAFAFDSAASQITTQICNAYSAAKTVLVTAAVLALIIGLAPMLWGQVKVKWIISALVGSMMFGLTSTIVAAFAQGSACS